MPHTAPTGGSCLVFIIGLCGLSTTQALDLDDPRDRLDAYIRTVGDTSGEPVVTYAHSNVLAVMPGRKAQHIFSMQVVGVGKYLQIDGGYRRLHREVAFYTNVETGEIMSRWRNPFVEREVEVLHVQNDPVNFSYLYRQDNQRARVRYVAGGDHVIFYREVPLRYPSALPYDEYPLHSAGDWYEAVELFNSYASLADLENDELTSVPETGSWSRIGPWLPWMEMGNREGHLLYHGRSYKVMDGVESLPDKLLAYMREHHPKYLTAPETDEQPNETSWTFFKKVIDRERAAQD